MDIVANIIIGFTNGIFSSGAGQILLLYYIYLKKYDSKKEIAILCIISIIFGTLGNTMMKKMNSNILNLISGVILVAITAINMWCIK